MPDDIQTPSDPPVRVQPVVSALAEELWGIAYKAACEADPNRYWNSVTWEDEKKYPGRKAAWEALAIEWMKRANEKGQR